jgi:hypothetical protein
VNVSEHCIRQPFDLLHINGTSEKNSPKQSNSKKLTKTSWYSVVVRIEANLYSADYISSEGDF